MIYAYPCQLSTDEDGEIVATFPDVPEALTGGKNRSEAMTMGEEALAVALAGYVRRPSGHVQKWDIPTPSVASKEEMTVPVPPVVAAKLALYTAMKEQGITKVELARRLGVSESAVRKLTNPDHRSHVSLVQKALKAVGRSMRVEVTEF